MKASVGDRIIIEGRNLGDGRRVGIITAVAHPDGRPPYHVRWLADGHVSVVFPGAGARILSAGRSEPAHIG
jgi:hypothetical protein